MKRLIINADDFGLTPGVTRGILDAHLNGVVTSASALMNSPQVTESLNEAFRVAPNLGMGVHLVLTWNKPLLKPEKVPSLVDGGGYFYGSPQISEHADDFNLNDVRNEWQAQIEAFIATGRRPDHLDSHHHSSYINPKLFTLMLKLAQKYSLPIRYPSIPEESSLDIEPFIQILGHHSVRFPQSCITAFYDEGVSFANLSTIISMIPEGISELMCHPGLSDSDLMKGSSYAAQREAELRILKSKDLKECIKENSVSLARFSDL